MFPRSLSTLPLLICLLLVPAVSFATHYYVYEDGSGDFATIGDAVDSVASGDTILVGCGTYDEPDIDPIYWAYPWIQGLAGDPACVTLNFRIEADEGAYIQVSHVTFANGGGMGADGEDDEGVPVGGSFSAFDCIFDAAPVWTANSGGASLRDCILRNSFAATGHAASCIDAGIQFLIARSATTARTATGERLQDRSWAWLNSSIVPSRTISPAEMAVPSMQMYGVG